MSPIDPMDDDPVPPNDRVSNLERTVDEVRSQGEANQALLRELLLKLGPALAPQPNAPTHTQPPATSRPLTPIPTNYTPSAGRKTILRPSVPTDFDGDRAKGKAFLMSCRTYIRLCPEAFADDDVKIVWALSYMKSGRAGRWAAREFEYEAKSESNNLRFLDWVDFEQQFRKDFTPLNEEATAINVLETTAYFQGRRSVDDYLDQFRDLIDESGYTDPKTIVVKFRRGLDRRIANALAGMATGRPSDMDPENWFRLAVRMDQNRAADEAFHSSTKAAPGLTPTARPGLITIPKAAPARFAHVVPTPGNPVPMEIDATRKAKALPDNCRRCGGPGHWAKDCPDRFDVRLMDADELQTYLEDMLAAKDAAPVEPRSPLEEKPAVASEDFVSSRG
jgi:hypothetical protein